MPSNVTLSLSLILFVKEKNLLRKREKKNLIQEEAHIKKREKRKKKKKKKEQISTNLTNQSAVIK